MLFQRTFCLFILACFVFVFVCCFVFIFVFVIYYFIIFFSVCTSGVCVSPVVLFLLLAPCDSIFMDQGADEETLFDKRERLGADADGL